VEEVNTEFGTRVLLIPGTGCSVTVVKNEDESTSMLVQDAEKRRVEVQLGQIDLLTLIEFFALAAKPGTGKPYVEMPALGEGDEEA
jgi:hypothetical protein